MVYRKFCSLSAFLAAFLFFPVIGHGAVIELKDGSRVTGDLVSLRGGVLVMDTAFAGQMRVDASQVHRFYESEQAFDAADAQPLPQIGEESEIASVSASAVDKPDGADWSGSLTFALNGADGNTEEFNFSGKAVIKRETEKTRAKASLQGRFEREDGEETENEVIAKGNYEHDLTERLFGFVSTSFEQDKFEDLDLRANVLGGLGYFLIKEEDQFWKPRIGLGYEFEKFESGDNENDIILTLGHDYEVKAFEKLKFTHAFDYIPSLDDAFGDYRIESDAAVLYPFDDEETWNLELGLRNQYDSEPEPGIEELDTYYSVGLKREFK